MRGRSGKERVLEQVPLNTLIAKMRYWRDRLAPGGGVAAQGSCFRSFAEQNSTPESSSPR
jgi:hypothetical protein